MNRLKKLLSLSAILLFSNANCTIPDFLRKGCHAALDYGVSYAFGLNNPNGAPSIYAAISSAENSNKYSFNTLNKKINIIALFAILNGAAIGIQEFDFNYLGPKTGYITGFAIPLAYWSLYQTSTWLDKFEKKELPWQQEGDEPEGEENAPQTPEAPVLKLETSSPDERSSTGSVDSAAGLLGDEQPSPHSPIRQRRGLTTAPSCMDAVKVTEKELTKKVNETFTQDWRRRAAKFAALGSLAALTRHYFDNAASIPLQIKWAEQVSDLVEKMPTPKPIPLKVLAFATKIAAMYGASYGLNILDDYIISSQPPYAGDGTDFIDITPWSTNLGIVATWAASQILAKNLKEFCELPESYFTKDRPVPLEVFDFDEEQGIPEEGPSEQERSACSLGCEVFQRTLGNFGSKLGRYLKRTNGYRLSRWLISKRPTREAIRFAANGISSAMIHHRLQSLGFVPTIKFAENINALVNKIPTPKPIPLHVATKIAKLGALYGSSYALAYLDDYLARTYGFQTNYQTAAILASIMNFSENIGEVVKHYENKDNQQAPSADIELTRMPAAAQ